MGYRTNCPGVVIKSITPCLKISTEEHQLSYLGKGIFCLRRRKIPWKYHLFDTRLIFAYFSHSNTIILCSRMPFLRFSDLLNNDNNSNNDNNKSRYILLVREIEYVIEGKKTDFDSLSYFSIHKTDFSGRQYVFQDALVFANKQTNK